MLFSTMLSALTILSFVSIVQSVANSEFKLTQLNSRYAAQLVVGTELIALDLIIDTGLSISLINSVECKICQKSNTKNYDPTKSKSSTVITPDAIYQRRKYQYNGTQYQDSFTISDTSIGKFSGLNPFLSIVNISLTTEISESGYLSLNYYSDFFRIIDRKKIITLELSDSIGVMKIGEINTNVVNITNLVYFPISLNPEDKTWYLHGRQLSIKGDKVTPLILNDQKLMVDTTTWQFHIPRKVFYDNLDTIIPIPCQIQLNGLFHCNCQTGNYAYFPTYQFLVGSEKLDITPQHYASYDSSSRICILHININYYTEYWVIGLSLLNKNQTLIDFDNAQPRMAFITNTVPKKTDTNTFIIVFVSVAVVSCLFFFGGYMLYKKYFLQANNNEGHHVPINQDI